MAKKKNARQKHQKEACEGDTSDEELMSYNTAKICPHITKSVNMNRVKKALKNNHNLEKCKDCNDTVTENASNDVDDEGEVAIKEVWLCLQCGYCGCGRSTTNQHAMLHYKTPHSDSHAVVLSTTSLCIWCYICDESVLLESSRNLKECVDLIVKNKDKKPPASGMVNGSTKNISKNAATGQSAEVANKSEKGSPVLKSKQNDASGKSTNVNKKNSPVTVKAIKGLRNLGNTCFFNAVLQSMCQTPWLLEELEQRSGKEFVWEIPYLFTENESIEDVENPLKAVLLECGQLTQAFFNFLKQMKKPSQDAKPDVVNPNHLFDQICKKSPQFRGFHQQDSHELLRHLLDGIRNEEIKRQKKAILRAFKLSEKIHPDCVDEETKQLIKAYGGVASHTIAERIFGGQLISTVVCEECKVSSQVFEPFMDLSLPLAEEKVMRSGKVQKQAENDEIGMHAISKKKDEGSLSKHQERKMKQQAKKSAKKKAKIARSINSTNQQDKGEESIEKGIGNELFAENTSSLEDGEHENANIDEKEDGSNHEHSDADVEDNDESENVINNPSRLESDNQVPSNCVSVDINDGSGDASTLDNRRIKELCSQITDIRIRQDSDKKEDLLNCMDDDDDENPVSGKQQQSSHNSTVNSVLDETKCEEWSHPQSEQQTKEWVKQSLTTLQARYQPSSMECSVNSCLNQFTASELLTGSNKFRCENCTDQKRKVTGDDKVVVYSNASKQLLIFSPPAVLTLHLKRFQQTGMSLRKLNLFVEFPEILDLAPYCSSVCLWLPHMAGVKDEVLYSLYGVVQHCGRLTSGHYTAYIKIRDDHCNPAFLNAWPTTRHCNLEQLLDKISKVKMNNDTACNHADSGGYKWYYVSDSFYKEVTEAEVLRCQAYILFYQRIK